MRSPPESAERTVLGVQGNDEQEYQILAEGAEHDDAGAGGSTACIGGNIELLDQLGGDTVVYPQADKRDPEGAGGEVSGGVRWM